jgi:hypothetical protein
LFVFIFLIENRYNDKTTIIMTLLSYQTARQTLKTLFWCISTIENNEILKTTPTTLESKRELGLVGHAGNQFQDLGG